MYLKSIEVHGFKSFAHKLVFEFNNGITGIVGPNGSGKSNVADAVRWVLGEQSAKQLRGSSMQDVIFSGTQMRKPQSYAYVALTISNEDHKLNLPYEEIKVARRVYRSGESEYLINGTSCRLRDVQELFFDTGIGKEGYSIIGQGQIDKILSGKPEERRELFDEAAGIVKFKKRKAAAQKNLAIESQNLLRVKDILAELEKQVGPLEVQSQKAREYLSLKEDLKRCEISLFCMDYESLQNEIGEVGKNTDNTKKELDEAKRKKEQSKAQYEEVEKQISGFDSSIGQKKERVNSDKILLTNIESEIRVTEEKIISVTEGREYYKERAGVLADSRAETQKELDDYRENSRDALETLGKMQQEETEKNSLLLEIEISMAEKEEELNLENQEVINSINRTSKINIEHQKMQSMLEQNTIRKAELNKQILSNKSQYTKASEEMEREDAAFQAAKKALDEEYASRDSLLAKAKQKRAEILSLEKEQQKTQKRYHMESSKLATLKNMAERYDGYGQSIRRVMEQKKEYPGLLGVVADIIHVKKEYETAIETALGGSIQNIVTDNEHTAKAVIGYLKRTRGGRATFLPLTTVTAKRENPFSKQVLSEHGVLGKAADFVERESKYDKIAEYLLGRFLLVDTIENAMDINKKYRYSLRIVTLEGELLNPGGSLSGGAYKNSSNLLGRHREIEKLEEETDRLRGEIEDRKEKTADFRREAEKLEKSAAKKMDILKELELKKNTAKIHYEQAVSVKEQKEREYFSITSDGKEIERQKEEIEETLKKIGGDLARSHEREQGAKNRVQALTQELEEDHRQQTEYQELLSQIRVNIVSFQEKNSYITENIQRIEGSLKQIEEEYESLMDEQSRSAEEAGQMQESIDGYKKKCGELKDEIENLLSEIETETKQKDELMESQRDFFEQRDALMEHINELNKESFRLESRKNNLEEKLEAKVNYMWEEYEITFHNAAEYGIDRTVSYTRMKGRTEDIKVRIRELGSVNVNAIEDYKAIRERYEMLKTQHDDLTGSEEKLKNIIEELDEEMRKQFAMKFTDIQKQFDKVFRELFGGGKGTLELVGDEDILEAGIIINAQPPGKKLTNMMQLSGGEKALTAISLLFAIQNLKPSPFCLLDEIEAALDDSNVKRYAKYLHKLTKETQFIVITHRKGTMEAADVLYGITMQEKGVSTLVSVKLIEEQLDD